MLSAGWPRDQAVIAIADDQAGEHDDREVGGHDPPPDPFQSDRGTIAPDGFQLLSFNPNLHGPRSQALIQTTTEV